jgi:protein SCO1/2
MNAAGRHAGASIAIAMLLALAGGSLGCDRASASEPAKRTTVSAVAPAVTADSPSIYAIHVALRDQNGEPIDLDVHRGHPVIVSMFYGSCPSACPLLVSHVKELEASLPPAVRDDVRVLLVSFDPEHDTPQSLSELAKRHHVASHRWRLASGTDDDVRPIAGALDVSYRKQASGAYTHDSVIAVLDGEGRIVARTEDTMPDLAPLAAAVLRVGRAP